MSTVTLNLRPLMTIHTIIVPRKAFITRLDEITIKLNCFSILRKLLVDASVQFCRVKMSIIFFHWTELRTAFPLHNTFIVFKKVNFFSASRILFEMFDASILDIHKIVKITKSTVGIGVFSDIIKREREIYITIKTNYTANVYDSWLSQLYSILTFVCDSRFW